MYREKLCMTTRYNQCNQWRLQIWMFEEPCKEVALDMMYSY
jgi:hypothetical protein